MDLMLVHRIVIGVAIVGGALFTFWSTARTVQTADLAQAAISVVALVATVGLAFYLKRRTEASRKGSGGR